MTSKTNYYHPDIRVRYHPSYWYHNSFEWTINRRTILNLVNFVTTSHRLPYTSFFFFFFGSPDCSIQQAVYKHVSLLYSFSSISSTRSTYSVLQTRPEIIHCWPVVFRIGIHLCAFDIVIGLFCVLLWSVYHILIVLLVNHIYTSSTICSSVLVKAQLSHPHKLPRISFQYRPVSPIWYLSFCVSSSRNLT